MVTFFKVLCCGEAFLKRKSDMNIVIIIVVSIVSVTGLSLSLLIIIVFRNASRNIHSFHYQYQVMCFQYLMRDSLVIKMTKWKLLWRFTSYVLAIDMLMVKENCFKSIFCIWFIKLLSGSSLKERIAFLQNIINLFGWKCLHYDMNGVSPPVLCGRPNCVMCYFWGQWTSL